jgi:hypothetical protein
VAPAAEARSTSIRFKRTQPSASWAFCACANKGSTITVAAKTNTRMRRELMGVEPSHPKGQLL